MNEIQKIAFEYGRAVAWREYYEYDLEIFDSLDADCMNLWRRLIEIGAYEDEEHTILSDEARKQYFEGMNSVPTKASMFFDWEDGTDWQEDHDE